MIHTLENEELRIRISDHGAELSELYDKKNNRQVLWDADPAYWKRHAPVLFPNVGRYYEGFYLIHGTAYQSGQHGFARDMEFSCISKTEDSITHLLESSAETMKSYPFGFRLFITHQLKGRDVTVTWTVENPDDKTIYFTIGGHPAFRVPVLPGTSRNQYFLTFDQQEELTYCLLDLASGTALPDKTETLSLTEGRCPIPDHLFDRDALIFDHGQISRAGIALPDGSPYVEICCEGFPNFGIWSVPDGPFICLEPWMGRCDNYGFSGELSEKPGINQVPAGESFRQKYLISVK